MYFANLITGLISDLISLLFPNLCCACGTSLHHGEVNLCTRCIHDLPYTDHHTDPNNKAAKKLWGRIQFNAAMSLLHFRKGGRVQNIIHQLKYGNNPGVGLMLGKMLGEKLQRSASFEGITLVIPIPLHRKRERTRGYNQSQSIAEGIAAVLQVPVNNTAVIRRVATRSQTNKGRFSRFENMKDVFQIVNDTALRGSHVLLVDDVLTTGATIESCAAVLNKCGVKKLSIATLAFAN